MLLLLADRRRPSGSLPQPPEAAGIRDNCLAACQNELLGVGLQIFEGVTHGFHLVGVFIGDVEAELLLESHDQFYGVQRIRPEILDELCFRCELVNTDFQLLGNDFLRSLFVKSHEQYLLAREPGSRIDVQA